MSDLKDDVKERIPILGKEVKDQMGILKSENKELRRQMTMMTEFQGQMMMRIMRNMLKERKNNLENG